MAKEQLTGGAAPALVVSHLTKRFGDRSAFEDVSFEVADVYKRQGQDR